MFSFLRSSQVTRQSGRALRESKLKSHARFDLSRISRARKAAECWRRHDPGWRIVIGPIEGVRHVDEQIDVPSHRVTAGAGVTEEEGFGNVEIHSQSGRAGS